MIKGDLIQRNPIFKQLLLFITTINFQQKVSQAKNSISLRHINTLKLVKRVKMVKRLVQLLF